MTSSVAPFATPCHHLTVRGFRTFQTKHPLQFPGEGVSHDPHPRENGSGLDDPLESVGLGSSEAVEAF